MMSDRLRSNECRSRADALIVTFEPDLVHLERLIGVLRGRGLPTTVADNGSSSLCSIREICDRHCCAMTGGESNHGLPTHLNNMLESSIADWILYLDQDSGLTSDALATLLSRLPARDSPENRVADIGLICPTYRQVSTGRPGYSDRHLRRVIHTPIGSGSIYSRKACQSIGGFSELFPLDLLDFDTALRLQDHGFEVQIQPDIEVEHQVGDRPPASGIGQPELHAPWRYFLKADGTRRMVRRHGLRHPGWVSKLVVARVVEVIRSSKFQRDHTMVEEFGRGLIGLRSRRVPHDLLVMLRSDR